MTVFAPFPSRCGRPHQRSPASPGRACRPGRWGPAADRLAPLPDPSPPRRRDRSAM